MTMDAETVPSSRKDMLARISHALISHHMTMATAESCTGGLAAAWCTSVSGSSTWFSGAVVAYDNRIKRHVLGVDAALLDRHGAVSGPCVEQMVFGVQRVLQVDAALAISGVAGPTGGSPEKPVGTVWIAWGVGKKVLSRRFQFSGDREAVRTASVEAALAGMADLLGDLG